jgi:predicted O-methyltransferase YrrM
MYRTRSGENLMAQFHAIDPALREYILSVSLRESPSLAMIREKTANHPCAKMQIPPEEGQLLALLVKLIGARKVLEIGTFTGYSTLAIAEALPDDGRVIAIDKNREWTSRAERFWKEAGQSHKIELRIGDGCAILDELRAEKGDNSFDFVFIDADKKNYSGYFERALLLSRPNALIAVDNTLWRAGLSSEGPVDGNTEALRAFNASLRDDDRIDLSILPVADGMTLARKR